jgi:hypothetical protein
MSGTGRIAVFVVGLLVVLAGAVGIGSLVDPADTEGGPSHKEGGHAAERHGEGSPKEEEMFGHGGHQQMTQGPAGLGVSEGGYSLRITPAFLKRSEDRELHFSIADADGQVVSDFDELHERRMHLIVVRRDGTGFRHLHPEMDEAGTWTVPVEFTEAGVYRAFADFSVAGEQHTLASDLFVSGGDFEARPFPAPASVDSTSGYEVRLQTEELVAGHSSSLTFSVTRDDAEVDDLAPYLGAKGHLVALREGDLAFLHVHPEEVEGEDAAHGHGEHAAAASGTENEIAFAASFPTAGHYRLYLQFKHEGSVRTAEFTVAVPR